MQFVWLTTLPGSTAKPAVSTIQPGSSNTHIVSFVNGKRGLRPHDEFDFERNEAESINSVHVQQLFGSLLQLQAAADNNKTLDTDDAPVSERNTLDDELSLDAMVSDEQHESSTEYPDAWHRIKLAIPVLEPVKHLINAVGGGDVNDTHVRTNSHRLIGHMGVHHAPHSNNTSPAIETEEDREEAIDSTGFDLLETLGSAGTVLWGMLQNLRRLFAASAGNASTAFSGGGGGGGAGGGGAGRG
ncbi:GH23253 [Drosophila grimshawi]|uniref:GH23253 n=1 Tax=Drosophila grimshawi TaxID=7222 RepID=B4JSZ5_DROGR|nr:GH23253 [Drosophila grimshawi]